MKLQTEVTTGTSCEKSGERIIFICEHVAAADSRVAEGYLLDPSPANERKYCATVASGGFRTLSGRTTLTHRESTTRTESRSARPGQLSEEDELIADMLTRKMSRK